jgi:hypothetical protein
VPELDRVEPPLAGLNLGDEALRPAERLGDLGLGKAGGRLFPRT